MKPVHAQTVTQRIACAEAIEYALMALGLIVPMNTQNV
jgi:hypothetical protein